MTEAVDFSIGPLLNLINLLKTVDFLEPVPDCRIATDQRLNLGKLLIAVPTFLAVLEERRDCAGGLRRCHRVADVRAPSLRSRVLEEY